VVAARIVVNDRLKRHLTSTSAAARTPGGRVRAVSLAQRPATREGSGPPSHRIVSGLLPVNLPATPLVTALDFEPVRWT
jgi:hypothetical protein